MAITNASRLADFGTGIGTAGAIIQVDNDNNRLGVGTNNPQSTLQVGIGITMDGNAGIITANKFVGDGSGLVNAGVTTDLINSTQIKNIGVVTTGTAIVGSAVTINSTGIDAVSGVVTAANFVGGGANLTNLSGTAIASGTVAAARVATLNQNTTGTSGGLTGTPDVTVNNIVGVAATFTGVLTYEDVTNVDSVGIITARSGIEFGAAGVGGTITAVGNAEFAGITTIGSDLSIADKIIHTGDTNTAIRFPAADTITAETGGSEALRVDSTQRLLINKTASTTSNGHSILQVASTSNDRAIAVHNFENDASGPYISLGKSRGTSVNSYTIVQDNDELGNIDFFAADGTDFSTIGARIQAEVDGTPGVNDMPSRLIFATTADGANNPTERLRITSTGQLELSKDQDGVTGRPTNRIVFKDTDSSVAANQPIGEISWYSTDAGMVNVNSYIRGINEATNGSGALLFGVKAAGSSEIEALRITSTGNVEVAGITSTASLTVGAGLIQEKFYNQASALTGTYNQNVLVDGMILHAYSNASASFVLNLRGDASTTLNSLMHIGQSVVFTAYTGSNNASYYMTDFQIDGSSQTEKWNGGSAPSAGTGSGTDVYTFNILKTADATFTVYATLSNFA